MTPPAHPDDLLGAYASGGCDPDESARVEAHVNGCARCTAELETLTDAARWIGPTHTEAALPAGLRTRVLTAALRSRPARADAAGAHLDPYVAQVTAFGRLIADLDESHWRLPTGPYPTVRDLVVHLTTNDRYVVHDLGASTPPQADPGRGWQAQADGLLRTVAGGGTPVLTRPVRLAGGTTVGPLRDALTQRAFETWIHADDIRLALRMPTETPPPAHVARIIGFGLRLLPGVLDAVGRSHPGRSARLVLTGPGGGTHAVALSARAGGPEVAEITLPAVLFCKLMAARTTLEETAVRIDGDTRAATDLLAVAATLGCD